MTYLNQFLQSDNQVISNAAGLLENATNEYHSGNLSKVEYDELCNNILDLGKINTLVTDMHRRQEIYNAFQAMRSLLSFIPFP